MTRHSADGGRTPVWAAGLLVAAGAATATAHGLYEVAIAARVPAGIAWLYPLITDGLALVAYAATARLTDAGRRYAWTVVVLAAGLSGLAQASYLAGGVNAAPTPLRFGVGAWPAIAAAIVAHLLHLLGPGAALTPPSQLVSRPIGHPGRPADAHPTPAGQPPAPTPDSTASDSTTTSSEPHTRPDSSTSAQANPSDTPSRTGGRTGQRGQTTAAHQHTDPSAATRSDTRPDLGLPGQSDGQQVGQQVGQRPRLDGQPGGQSVKAAAARGPASARDRARSAARSHQSRHGRLPTVSELARLAQVARSTAGTALKELRAERPALQIVRTTPETSTDQ